MKRNDKLLTIAVIALIISLFGNVFAVSHYFGQQSVMKKYQTFSQQKAHDAEAYTFRDLALSLSTEGRKILADIFLPRLPEIMETRSVVQQKRRAAKALIDSETFTKEQFLDAVADSGGAQQKFQELMKNLFVEAVIALPEQDRKILARNFRKMMLSNRMNAQQEQDNDFYIKEGTQP